MDIILPLVSAAHSLACSQPELQTKDFLSACRNQLDYYVFDVLKKLYAEPLQKFWDGYTIPFESDKAIVIVERRAHPNLLWCIQNAVYFCRGYSLHIFCSEANLSFVKYMLGSQVENVHIHTQFKTIGTPAQGYEEYNQLLQTKSFWESIPEEHIITLETDSYFLKPLPESIYSYDYVASVWPWLPKDPGGGGLSYRKRSMMLKICESCPPKPNLAQDVFAGDGIKALGYKFPPIEESHLYFTESLCSEKAVGTHQWWTFLVNDPNLTIEKIYNKCMLYTMLPIT